MQLAPVAPRDSDGNVGSMSILLARACARPRRRRHRASYADGHRPLGRERQRVGYPDRCVDAPAGSAVGRESRRVPLVRTARGPHGLSVYTWPAHPARADCRGRRPPPPSRRRVLLSPASRYVLAARAGGGHFRHVSDRVRRWLRCSTRRRFGIARVQVHVFFVAAWAPIVYFHPEDTIALAFVLGACLAIGDDDWRRAGAFVAIALLFKQWALWPALPFLIVAPRGRRAIFGFYAFAPSRCS